jgi:hypothetical protein
MDNGKARNKEHARNERYRRREKEYKIYDNHFCMLIAWAGKHLGPWK